MKLFSEKVEPTFTDSNINILGVRNFKEIFVDVFEFEINGKKFIAEKVSEHNGMPVINIPVVFKSNEYIAPFALRRGAIEILFNEDNAIFVKPVLEGVHELLEQHSENEKEEIYSFIKNTVEETANKLSSDIENKTKYVESLVNEKIINLTTNTIPNIFLKNMKGSDDSNLVDIRERLESIGTEIGDVKAEKESICTDLKALAEETSHLSENVDKKINNTLSRVGSIKAALENSIESAVGDLNKKIEDVETNIERYYSEKITNVSNEVHELTEQNKQDLIELIESSKQSILEEISLIKNNVPNIVIEKANGKQEIDLKGIKTELEKIIGTKFSTEIAALRRIIEMSSGGGSVAKQFANGGTMDGNLTVVGTISAQSYAGIPNPDLTQYLPISGGTVTGNLTVNGTLSTTLLEALSANITVIDIKQYELSGFNVNGNATVQGSISATGDLTVHKRLNFAGDANGANNLYFVRNSTNNWTWGSNGVGDIMGIAGNSVTIGQDTTFTRQGITIRNLGETTGATLLGEAPDVLAQRRRTGTAPQEFRLYGLYDGSGANREYAYIKSLSASSFTIGTSATGTGANRSLEFQTAGSTRMTIQSGGNVLVNNGTLKFPSRYGGTDFAPNSIISNFTTDNQLQFRGGNGGGRFLFTSADDNWDVVIGNGLNLGFTTGTTPDLRLYRDAANTLAQRNSTNPQEFRLYNTYTDAANYERGFFRWDTNTFKIGLSAGGTGVNRNLEFVAGGSTRMTLTSGGDVGVGTTTPVGSGITKLHIAGNGGGVNQYGSISLSNASGSGNNIAGAIDYYTQGNLIASIRSKVVSGGNTGELNFLLASSGTLTHRLRINSSGNIIASNTEGWGGSGAKFDVEANGSGSATRGLNLSNLQTANNSAIEIGFRSYNTSGQEKDFSVLRGLKISNTPGNEEGGLAIYTTGSGSSTEKFRISGSGNVGIGTTTPNEKLTVSGNISATGNITSNTNYVVSVSLSADITANNGTDTPLIFPLIKADPSGWTSVSGSNTRITPTVPGYYNVSYMLAWRPGTSGSGNQNNIQIIKNGATVSLAQQPIHVSADVNTTQVATALVYMNGTTDYLTFQAYSSNAAQVIIGDSNWSKVEFFKIN